MKNRTKGIMLIICVFIGMIVALIYSIYYPNNNMEISLQNFLFMFIISLALVLLVTIGAYLIEKGD